MAKKVEKNDVLIWVVYLESNINGEIIFGTIPCKSLAMARKMLKKEKEFVLNESYHFSRLDLEEFKVEYDDRDHFFINDPSDDYYEDYYIVEQKLY